MALTEDFIKQTYSALKNRANIELSHGRIHKCMINIHLAAFTSYSFFLNYNDEELEAIVRKASCCINKTFNYKADENRCVFLDSLARFRGGLTVQYLNAIIAAGWEVLYITPQDMSAPQHYELNSYLNSLNAVSILQIPVNVRGRKRLQFIYNAIIDYAPSRLYEHFNTYDAYFSTVAYSVPNTITKFAINIADHASSLGYSSGDYSFEFRQLGCSIASKFRGRKKSSMFLLPFYPVIDNKPFKGLPECCQGKKIVLSGGAFWKIIDANDTFFKLVSKMLEENKDTILLYPGAENPDMVKQKIVQYGLTDKFILLGWRDDISELYRHSDVFLNTYPHGGGTMSQYAAHLHVPILSFRPEGECQNPVECFVCQVEDTKVSSIGESEFLEEAHKLLSDVSYRKEKADKVYDCVLGIGRFNSYFKSISENHTNIIPFDIEDVVDKTTEFMTEKIKYANKTGVYQTRIISLAGLNPITMKKEFVFPFVKSIIPKLTSVIRSRGLHFNRI